MAQSGTTTTLTGCVYQEKDVPGRTPNVAERAGILEDYILAEVSPQAEAGASATAGTAGTTGTAGTAGTATTETTSSTAAASGKPMYKLEHADDDRLRALVGKRVEVTGRIDAEAGDQKSAPAGTAAGEQPDRSIGPDRIELPEFEVTSIREVAGTCPATPSKPQQ